MNNNTIAIAILTMAIVTFLVRCLPFYCLEIFKNRPIIHYFANVLPGGIMLILVIFSIQDTALKSYPYGMPEFGAIVFIAAIHIYKRNLMLSTCSGILFYGLITYFL